MNESNHYLSYCSIAPKEVRPMEQQAGCVSICLYNFWWGGWEQLGHHSSSGHPAKSLRMYKLSGQLLLDPREAQMASSSALHIHGTWRLLATSHPHTVFCWLYVTQIVQRTCEQMLNILNRARQDLFVLQLVRGPQNLIQWILEIKGKHFKV